MALLQIHEPGEATLPHQHRLSIGIDLGTTHSLVATVRNGIPTVLPDAEGNRLFPSLVHYTTAGVSAVGNTAVPWQVKDPHNTIASVKRLMGRSIADIKAQYANSASGIPYRLVDQPGLVYLDTAAGHKTPIEVSAEILFALKQRAELSLLGTELSHNSASNNPSSHSHSTLWGDMLVGAVITVPAYFDEAQRGATRDSARLCGLPLLRLLNEPTAAALAYGLDQRKSGTYAIYDLGGGTFDISILRLEKGFFEVLAIGGHAHLGGDDFDQLLREWVYQQAHIHPSDLSASEQRLLLMVCRLTKEQLSTEERLSLAIPHLPSASDKNSLATLPKNELETSLSASMSPLWQTLSSLMVSRSTIDQLVHPLVQKTLQATRHALRDARLSVEDIDGVVLVGGATRMPQIREALTTLFGKPPLSNLNPDEVVALGAALQADALIGNRKADDDWLLLDVTPLSLGLETMGGLVDVLIPRNSTLPHTSTREFTTFQDGQTGMSIHVVQGERDRVEDCRSLARFDLRGLPPMTAGTARIAVTFEVDADGLLTVSARERTTNILATTTVRPSYGLDEATIGQMLTELGQYALQDKNTRTLRERQIEAKQMIYAVEQALAQSATLLQDEEKRDIEIALAELKSLQSEEDAEALKIGLERLNQATESFAARRMDYQIQKALTGRTLSQIA